MAIPLNVPGANGSASEPAKKTRRTLAGLRVLLAEDVEMVRDLITILLAREMMTVTAVTDGAAAVAAVEAEDYDLVILDVQMPIMGGIEASKRIRASGGHGETVPILALTGNVLRRDIAQCHAAGMDGHVPKPFTTEALINTIKSVLGE
ncbi:MAG TPA: response regulator [Asticcacaulis sp.]|nr:response regulator [Asticcacaulis sp.]